MFDLAMLIVFIPMLMMLISGNPLFAKE